MGGISDSQLKVRIAKSLEEIPPDALRLLTGADEPSRADRNRRR